MRFDKSEKTKILLIGPFAPPIGGMQTSLENILSSELKDKYDLSVLDITGLRTRKKGTISQGISHQIILFFRLAYLLIKKRPNIVHLHLKGGFYFYRRAADIILCRLFRSKLILQICGGDIKPFYTKGTCIRKLLIKFILGISNRVIALSNSWKDFLSTITKADNITVISNGVVISDFRLKDDVKRKLGLDDSDIMILFMGGKSYKKGAFDLLNFILKESENLENTNFIIAGRPDVYEDPEETIRTGKKFLEIINREHVRRRVQFVGELSGQEKIDYYLSADIFLLLSYFENFPNVMLEAMAAGLPIIITDVGGVRDVLQDGVNAFIIQPGDINTLSEKLKILLGDKDLRQRMGKTNLLLAKEKYDMPIIAKKIDKLYQELLK